MRRFMFATIDSVTGHEMVLSEVSFNKACDWLEHEFHPVNVDIYSYSKLNTKELYVTIRTVDIPLLFIYDENRGYLLRVDYSKLSY